MKKVLGKKQRISNESWLEAMEHIEEYVSRKELDKRVEKTVKEVRKMTKGKKAAFGWSGGKDSLALQKICEKAGITDCLLTVTDLEYPAFMDWVEENSPEGLTVINTGQNLEWLAKHEKMLFPQDSQTASRWFHIVQHRGQDRYYKDNGLDMMIVGRRRADGNYVGKGGNAYTTTRGITRYSPLADWSHEEVLAMIHYCEIDLPPIYGWHNGYTCGTHPWPARQWTGSMENGWKEIYEIDREIVEKASDYIVSAKEFLSERGNI